MVTGVTAGKQARHNTTMVFLVKALLTTATVVILLFDGWIIFHPGENLTLTGHAKVTDGDTLSVRLSLWPLPLPASVAVLL